MPQQLIYTSVPRGLVAGRSGYCTVCAERFNARAADASVGEIFLLSTPRSERRPGTSSFCLSRRGYSRVAFSRVEPDPGRAGLDFTSRSRTLLRFIYLVFTPEEVRQNAIPPIIFREWKGWVTSWSERAADVGRQENWPELTALAGAANIPAQTWQRLSGDAVNGYGLLEARAGTSFKVDGMAEDDVMRLFAESA